MVAAKSTVNYLRSVLPGQSDAWYERIACEILAGRMPLPKVDAQHPMIAPESTEDVANVPAQPDPEPQSELLSVNPARERFLYGQAKSKTKQLKQGTYQARLAVPSNIPDTVGEAIRQAKQPKPKQQRPASASTKWKLEKLVHGDKGAAARLAAKVSFDHPDKTEQWCWEKAIFDITRDRH